MNDGPPDWTLSLEGSLTETRRGSRNACDVYPLRSTWHYDAHPRTRHLQPLRSPSRALRVCEVTSALAPAPTVSHLDYCRAIRTLALDIATQTSRLTPGHVTRVSAATLLYGVGSREIRGQCIYGTWKPNGDDTRVDVIEISA